MENFLKKIFFLINFFTADIYEKYFLFLAP